MGGVVPEMHHGSDCSAKNSKWKETPEKELSFPMNKNVQQEVNDIKREGYHLGRRVSPRLQNRPKEKQPFYGSAERRPVSASKDKVYSRKTDCDDSEEPFHYSECNLPSKEAKIGIDARKTLTHVSKIRSEGHLFVQRVSPRLKDIPVDKRPYYGSVRRKQLSSSKNNECDAKTQDNDSRELYSFKDRIVGKKFKDETTTTKNDAHLVQKIKLDRNILKQQISPRHSYSNLEKRPHQGSNQKRKLDATNGNHGLRKHEDDDCKSVHHFPDDNTSKQETEVGRSMLQCQLNMGHISTVIADFEDEAYLEFTRHEPFLTDGVHPRSGSSVRESLVGPMVSMLTYKDSNYYSHNSDKIEVENGMRDVTMRKNAMQNSQKKGLTGLPLERRASPRLRKMSKQPFYGSNEKGKLNAANDNISDNNDQNRQSSFPKYRTPCDYTCNKNDQNRQASSPNDKMTIKKSSVDNFIRKLLPTVATKDITSSGRVNHRNGESVDLENYVSPKSLGYKKLSAHQMCEKVGEKMKETVMDLDKQYPSIAQGRTSKDFSELPGLVCEDISSGKESMCIPATNMIDPPTAPSSSGFIYINTFKIGKDVAIPPSPPGCNCRGNCTNRKHCSCARLNGSDFPYVNKDGGRLIEPKDVVFECGPGCGCGPNCVNRTSQQGLKYQLEVYRTMNKGWAVRSWDFIPSGAFVCEYIGVIRKSSEVDNENVSENEFIFQIDCWHTMKGIGGRERRQGDVSKQARSLVDKVNEGESETEFCVDGGVFGNVTRFINHSCDPNLFVQCVLSSHRDIRLARIALFAADDIPPLQELTYDYGYELDSVIGPDGKVKKLACYCGTSECRGRLY